MITGNDDAQLLENWRFTSYPESDDNHSDADDETPRFSSPCPSELSHEDQGQSANGKQGLCIGLVHVVILT